MKKLLQSLFILLCLAGNAMAQDRTITGTVTDKEDGKPLPGVTVRIVGAAGGTQTAASGQYSLVVPAGSTQLQFSYLGYTTQTVTISGNSVSISLANDAQQLGEVVVTANNIRREARSLGYAATTVNTEELTKAHDRSALNALQGKVAGVQISNASGSPGSSSRVVIRGGTSLTGNNQALFVVDGMPIDNTSIGTGDNLNNGVDAGNRANDINPDDIESMTILKGPTAAALYGSRASNGAIIITTKNGSGLRGKSSEIAFNSSLTFENILRLPDFQNEYGQGGQMVPDLRENFSWGPKFDGKVRPWGQEIDGEQRVKPYGPLPDNVKNFFELGRTFNNTVSFAQSGEKSSYYLSFGNVDQKGVMPGTKYARTSVKVSGTSKITDKVYSNASVTYTRSTGDLSVQGQNNSPYDQVVQTPRDIPLTELKDYKNNKFNTLSGYYGAYTNNPYYLLGEDSYRNVVDRVLGTIQVGYKATDWLDLSYRIGTDVSADKRRQATSKRNILDEANQNFATNYRGRYEEDAFNIREINSDFIAAIRRDFTSDLKFTGTLGFNNRQRSYTEQVSIASALVVPNVYNLSNVDGTPTTRNREELRRLNGVYADLNLAYKNYLFLGITGRNDWSSTLPKGENSFFYPSVNTSFVFTDAFDIASNFLSFGKIRAGFAQVGNDADVYLLNSVYTKGTIDDGYQDSQIDFPLNGIPGFEIGDRIGNLRLKPEITTSFEVGLDLTLLNDRIGLEATYYSNESKDQIFNVPISPSSAFTSKTINAGSLTNKGVELLLRVTPVKTTDFRWDLTTTFTKNRSLVKELFGGTEQISLGGLNAMTLVAQVGQPYGSFYGTGNMTDDQGRTVIDASTGYPIPGSTPQILGNIQPKYLLGFNTTFNYKNFTLSGVLDIKKGGSVWSRTKSTMEFVGTTPLTTYNDRQPFVIPNSVILNDDGTYTENTTIKVANAQNYWTDHRTDAEQLLDASYVKLREVTLSYSLPKSLIIKTPFSGLQIGVSGRNLALWTPNENIFIDPEVSSFGNGNVQGYEYGSIPSMRGMTFNLRASF